MKLDLKRVATSALEAALNGEPEAESSHRLRGVRAVVTGAALMTAARAGQKHLPRLRERLADLPADGGDAGELEDYENEDDGGEAYEAEDYGGEDHEAEEGVADDEQEADDEQPSGRSGEDVQPGDEDGEPQPQDGRGQSDEDAESPDRDAGDLVDALSAHHSGPPVMEHMQSTER